PALICGARVFSTIAANPALAGTGPNNQPLTPADMTAINQNFTQAFSSILQSIHANLSQADSLALEDRVDLAIVLVQANQIDDVKQQILACIRTATSRDLRRLTPDQLYNFLSFMRQLGLLDVRPGLTPFILTLLTDGQRVQYTLETASTNFQAGHLTEAAALLEAAHARAPDSIPALVELARFRATAHDAALRNGPAAVMLALHAHELDHGEQMDILDVLACAYAEAGQFALAETTEKLALDKVTAILGANLSPSDRARMTDASNQYRNRIAAFHNQQPYHQ
ncbi:MAG TPA: hypothetical protein VK737_01190, partial [Opitutales bacterium]|nr:hypothetical protein [Opitutales bacterium]